MQILKLKMNTHYLLGTSFILTREIRRYLQLEIFKFAKLN